MADSGLDTCDESGGEGSANMNHFFSSYRHTCRAKHLFLRKFEHAWSALESAYYTCDGTKESVFDFLSLAAFEVGKIRILYLSQGDARV